MKQSNTHNGTFDFMLTAAAALTPDGRLDHEKGDSSGEVSDPPAPEDK